MHKTLALFAVIGTIASALPALAAPRPVAATQGQAIDECRQALFPDGGMDDYHKRPEISACVQRVEHGGPAAGSGMNDSNFY